MAYWGPAQDVHLIPLLAPLALLGYQGALCLRRGAAGALDWFGVLGFGFFGLLLWACYFAMLTGVPPRFASNFFKTAPGFTPEFKVLSVAFALLLAAGWVVLIFYTTRSPMRSLLRWAAGIVLLWGTGAMLLMPWADYQKSYRSVALQLRSKIPVGTACIAQKSLGVSQSAALDYHAGIRARPFDVLKPERLPAAPRARQSQARVRRARRRLGEARRRRPARRPRRAVSALSSFKVDSFS